jgi:hypothetical protein
VVVDAVRRTTRGRDRSGRPARGTRPGSRSSGGGPDPQLTSPADEGTASRQGWSVAGRGGRCGWDECPRGPSRAHDRFTIVADGSTPMTRWPAAIRMAAVRPWPNPTSRTVRPGAVRSRSSSARSLASAVSFTMARPKMRPTSPDGCPDWRDRNRATTPGRVSMSEAVIERARRGGGGS